MENGSKSYKIKIKGKEPKVNKAAKSLQASTATKDIKATAGAKRDMSKNPAAPKRYLTTVKGNQAAMRQGSVKSEKVKVKQISERKYGKLYKKGPKVTAETYGALGKTLPGVVSEKYGKGTSNYSQVRGSKSLGSKSNLNIRGKVVKATGGTPISGRHEKAVKGKARFISTGKSAVAPSSGPPKFKAEGGKYHVDSYSRAKEGVKNIKK